MRPRGLIRPWEEAVAAGSGDRGWQPEGWDNEKLHLFDSRIRDHCTEAGGVTVREKPEVSRGICVFEGSGLEAAPYQTIRILRELPFDRVTARAEADKHNPEKARKGLGSTIMEPDDMREVLDDGLDLDIGI
ncbi:hypothetical protein E8E14_011562 [Neopestalotiopsis sp. 37M]|nr:hypothetical protein E8E14_011562 [Neopestalotiopsis sp. 37M]